MSFNPESREYKGKYYTELVAYKIELVAAVAPVNTVSAEALSPTAGGVSFDSERSEAPANDDTLPPILANKSNIHNHNTIINPANRNIGMDC